MAAHIDTEIHRHYQLFASNFIALDILEGGSQYSNRYTEAEKKAFMGYVESQISKITIPNPDSEFLHRTFLTMYANPARNQLAVL